MLRVEDWEAEQLPPHIAPEIGQFRYNVAIKEQGLDDPYADHREGVLFDPLDETGHQITARKNGKLVGVGRINFLSDKDFPDLVDLLGVDALATDYKSACSIPTRLMVSPDHRDGQTAAALMIRGLSLAQLNGSSWCVSICKPDLLGFFLKLGWEVHRDHIDHPRLGGRKVVKYDAKNPYDGPSRIGRYVTAAAAREVKLAQSGNRSALVANSPYDRSRRNKNGSKIDLHALTV